MQRICRTLLAILMVATLIVSPVAGALQPASCCCGQLCTISKLAPGTAAPSCCGPSASSAVKSCCLSASQECVEAHSSSCCPASDADDCCRVCDNCVPQAPPSSTIPTVRNEVSAEPGIVARVAAEDLIPRLKPAVSEHSGAISPAPPKRVLLSVWLI